MVPLLLFMKFQVLIKHLAKEQKYNGECCGIKRCWSSPSKFYAETLVPNKRKLWR